jgi:hypothetical protein
MDKNTFLIRLSESPRTAFGRVPFEEQPFEQQVFSAIWALEGEVNGGGFASYLTGIESSTANFAPVALRAIGAVKCAAVVERALQIGSTGDLTAADQAFIAYPDNLTELLFSYVQARPDVFGAVSEVA